MKRIIIFGALVIFGCRSQGEWDSGSNASRAFEEQRMEERTENVNNQLPATAPGTETHRPF